MSFDWSEQRVEYLRQRWKANASASTIARELGGGLTRNAVVGKAHKTLGEEPVAVVHLKPGSYASEEELRHHCAQKIAAFKVPIEVIFCPETLPRNANGKIMKKELKAQLAARI